MFIRLRRIKQPRGVKLTRDALEASEGRYLGLDEFSGNLVSGVASLGALVCLQGLGIEPGEGSDGSDQEEGYRDTSRESELHCEEVVGGVVYVRK